MSGNGIKELNTPVPRPVYFFLAVTALFAVVYWVLMPALAARVDLHQGACSHRSAQLVTESVQAGRSRTAALDQAQSRPESFKDIQADSAVDGTGCGRPAGRCSATTARHVMARTQRVPRISEPDHASWLWAAIPKASPKRSGSASIPPIRKAGHRR